MFDEVAFDNSSCTQLQHLLSTAMAGVSEDEQLARALAASLEAQDRQRLVARTDQEEEEALSLAVAASLAEHEEQQQRQRGLGGCFECNNVQHPATTL